MRPISPRGAVRFGVFGSLSIMTSVMANTLRIITAGSEPMRDSRRVRLSQPRCTAHATAAGGVSERNPAKSPIRNANNSVIYSPKKALRTCYKDLRAGARHWFRNQKRREDHHEYALFGLQARSLETSNLASCLAHLTLSMHGLMVAHHRARFRISPAFSVRIADRDIRQPGHDQKRHQ